MPEQPRVFHLITRLLKGGAEAKTIDTIEGLDGYEFSLGHGAEFDPDQIRRLEQRGVSTCRFRTIRHYNPVTTIPAVLSVAHHLRRGGFDMIHTHSTEAGIIGRFAAKLAGTPAVVHTVHGVPFAEDRNPALERFVLGCERIAARDTDRIIANADAISRDYLNRGIGLPEQYATVYSGIDIDRFENATPASDITGDGTRILMVGRLTVGKGFEDLVEAVSRLDSEEISVYLVGEGPLRDELNAEIEKRELSENISLLGYRNDVPSVMAACDVFALPSYREGTPRVVTEAMASGLPVIATDIAGIPEQVQDGKNGILIQPGDINALTDGLDQLVSSESLRSKFSIAGQEQADRFSKEQMLSDLDSVYQDVLNMD